MTVPARGFESLRLHFSEESGKALDLRGAQTARNWANVHPSWVGPFPGLSSDRTTDREILGNPCGQADPMTRSAASWPGSNPSSGLTVGKFLLTVDPHESRMKTPFRPRAGNRQGIRLVGFGLW